MKVERSAPQAVITAARFDLRPLRKSDKGLLELHGSDERVARMTRSIPHPLPPGVVEAFIARAQADDRVEHVWAIDGIRSGGAELMGLISLEHMDRDQCEIGYWVAPAYWNTGIASAAVGALIDANPLRCNTVFAEVFQDNPASARVLTNSGFHYLGDSETFSVARDAAVPTWTYLRPLG